MADKNLIINTLKRANGLLSDYEYYIREDNFPVFNGDSFIGGNLGLVLYNFYYAKFLDDKDSEARAAQLLMEVFDRLDEGKSTLNSYSFSYGLSGLLLLLDHLVNHKFIEYDEEHRDLNEQICEWAEENIKKGDCEYLHGAIGALHYFSGVQQLEVDQELIARLLKAIQAVAVYKDEGAYIDVFNELVPEYKRGSINLSLSHGLSGIVLVLLNTIESGKGDEDLIIFVRRCLSYLKSQFHEVDFSQRIFCHFDSVQNENIRPRSNTRLAWCYGDLNQALLFLKAGQILQDTEYTVLGERIGLTALKRRAEDQTFVEHSTFCHGASGIAELFKTFYVMTGNPSFLEGYEYWIEETLKLLNNELDNGYYENERYRGQLLDGLPGSSIILMSYVSDEMPDWQKLFLL